MKDKVAQIMDGFIAAIFVVMWAVLIVQLNHAIELLKVNNCILEINNSFLDVDGTGKADTSVCYTN